MNMTQIERQFRADPRVESISDERFGMGREGDGIWIYFHPGWINRLTETHCIHEDTWTECKAMLRSIKPCACEGCEKEKNEPTGV
jgi:hypothetical protein